MKIKAPYFILLGACLTVACSGAVDDEQGDGSQAATTAQRPVDDEQGDGSQAATTAQRPGADSDSASSGCKGGVEHQYRNNGDGGVPGTMIALCASVVIDGKTCVVDPKNVGLDLGLDGNGWTVNANVEECFGGAILTVSGVDDVAYPQTEVRPFLSEASVWLATNEDSAGDGGTSVGAFSSHPAGASSVEEGPVASNGSLTVSVIKGNGHVVAAGGQTRDVVFDFSF